MTFDTITRVALAALAAVMLTGCGVNWRGTPWDRQLATTATAIATTTGHSERERRRAAHSGRSVGSPCSDVTGVPLKTSNPLKASQPAEISWLFTRTRGERR